MAFPMGEQRQGWLAAGRWGRAGGLVVAGQGGEPVDAEGRGWQGQEQELPEDAGRRWQVRDEEAGGAVDVAGVGVGPPIVALGDNGRPGFGPTIIASDIAQSQHRVDMRACPVHAGALQASLDDQLVATLHGAAADGQALRQVIGVLDLLLPLLQIGQGAGQYVQGRMGLLEGVQFSQHRTWTLLFEHCELLLEPLCGRWGRLAPDRFAHCTQVLGGMGEVEDAHGIGTVKINEPLLPFSAVSDCGDQVGLLDTPAMGLHQGQPPKGGRIGQARRSTTKRPYARPPALFS